MATVQKRGNTYRITASCGYDASGKQLRKSMTWTPTPGMTPKQETRELERQKVLFEEKCRTGQFASGDMKFGDFVEIWRKDYAQQQLAPETYWRYNTLLARILPAIGHLRLSRIQPQHLLQFYNDLAENSISGKSRYRVKEERLDEVAAIKTSDITKHSGIGQTAARTFKRGEYISAETMNKLCDGLNIRRNIFEAEQGKPLDPVTINHHHRLISSILGIAVQWQLIPSNPCERVKPPKKPHREAVYLDDKQAMHLVELLDGAPMQQRTMIITLLYTGMRIGELCGLEWKDINYDKHLISVQRSSQYIPGKGIITKEPKNISSIRTNKYAGELFALLKEYEMWQLEQRFRLGDKWEDHDRLFTQWNGKPIYPASLGVWFKKFLSNTDLPPITIHSLRHTNATLLIADGVDVRTVSKRLGHSQMSTTMNIYAHAIRSADEMAAEVIHLMPLKQSIKRSG